MDAYAKAFWLPKDGSSDGEYEDACFPRKERRYRGTKPLRFAIADGATEASYSRLWARLLVRAFVRGKLDLSLSSECLGALQAAWNERVRKKQLPWYAEEKLASGAFSSLLVLEMAEDGTETRGAKLWRVAAVGDSCLVQVRGEHIVTAFPLTECKSFDNSPNLLSSMASMNGERETLIRTSEGVCCSDDTLLLMTDALACWFFRESEAGGKPWNTLRDLDTEGGVSFQNLIFGLREDGRMKNDEVTLLLIDVVV